MSREELSRVEVMGRVKARSLQLREAAELLEFCGRVSNGAYTLKFRAAVLKQVTARYEDFGPTLAAEHLASDDGLEVHGKTLRRWRKQAGLWQRQRRRKPYWQWREAKAHFGELVQLDGSFHERLEERGPRGRLMRMVDDATTKALGWFSEEETVCAAAGVLRRWIERYGVPARFPRAPIPTLRRSIPPASNHPWRQAWLPVKTPALSGAS